MHLPASNVSGGVRAAGPVARGLAAVLCVGLGLAGCGDEVDQGDLPLLAADAGDGLGADLGICLGGACADADDPDGLPDDVAQADTGGPTTCEFAADPGPGEPGAACTSAADCDSGFCVEGPDGKVCSIGCVDCCPGGFKCEQLGTGSDTVFVCLPKLTALCRPCQADAECAALSAGALCLGFGDDGRFCGGACDADGDCPSGYACQSGQGTSGAGKQCVRTAGTCGCSPKAIGDGAATACGVTNELGTCTGMRKCAAEGLTACDAPAPATETCNGADDDCSGGTDEPGALGCQVFWLDADGDGNGQAAALGGQQQCLCAPAGLFTAATAADCDDASPAVAPGASEVCNGLDDDCDGVVDPGFADTDGDGVADCVDPDQDGDGVANADDCKPLDLAISPSVTEACNGIDDDCDGLVDEEAATGCQVFWADGDSDGYGKAVALGGQSKCLCAAVDLYTAATALDCNDADVGVHPAAIEACNDVDDDCDAALDEGCDDDKDGVCDLAMAVSATAVVCPKGKGDCNDENAAVFPGHPELCGNLVDDDCDGSTDSGLDAEGCSVFFKDGDKDGFGVFESQCLCEPQGLFSAGNNKDCADDDPLVNVSKQEICSNAKDDNCNGQQDEEDAIGCEAHYQDEDGDGFGTGNPLCLCGPSTTHTTKKKGDCDDTNPKVHPGAIEHCNAIDDNCQGVVDEPDAAGCSKYFGDTDGDGFGSNGVVACLCAPTAQFPVAVAGDCDDSQKLANPGATEACDGFDGDCDGLVDEPDAQGCFAAFVDGDGDGYGDKGKGACLCALGGPYNVQKGGDCNDKDAAVHPAATESCDGEDNDCDGDIDEQNALGCFSFMRDEDGDGYGITGVFKCLCKPAKPYSAVQAGDCDDTKSAINPKAGEQCDDIDNDCDGITDNAGADGCSPYFVDSDKDGYGTYFASSKCLCAPKAPHVAPIGGDCDDNDGKTYPKAAESCDGKDTDCDGILDPKGAIGCKTYYADGDSDGWGIANLSQCTCSPESIFTSQQPGDCNDQSSAIHPAAPEVCDGFDNNCNGQVDSDSPQASTYYVDNDGDGWGAGSGKAQCSAGGGYAVTKAGDCNDGNGAISPGAAEVQCNGVDEDCKDGDLCLCQAVNENFESGAPGWSIGGGWGVKAAQAYAGSGGLGFGTGSSYGAVTSTTSSSKNLAIPQGATKLTFWYRYSPDPGEYGGYDAFSISFGGQTLVSKTAGTKGNTGWTPVTFQLPSGWAGTTKTFVISFNCKDGAYNNGWGAAVDNIEIACN